MLTAIVVIWLVLAVLVTFGLAQHLAYQRRKQWHADVDAMLRRVGEQYARKRRNDARVQEAIRQVLKDRQARRKQEAAWRN